MRGTNGNDPRPGRAEGRTEAHQGAGAGASITGFVGTGYPCAECEARAAEIMTGALAGGVFRRLPENVLGVVTDCDHGAEVQR